MKGFKVFSRSGRGILRVEGNKAVPSKRNSTTHGHRKTKRCKYDQEHLSRCPVGPDKC